MKAESQKNKHTILYCRLLTYENHDEPFDVIVAQLALHHLPDYWKMGFEKNLRNVEERRDILFALCCAPSLIQASDSYFNKIKTDRKKSAGDEIAKETEIHIREEFSALDWIMESLLKSAGFLLNLLNVVGLWQLPL